MLEVDSHCPVAMTVSVDAHTRHGHESQSLSGDAARETNIEPRRAHGMRSVGARAVAGSAAQAPRRAARGHGAIVAVAPQAAAPPFAWRGG